MLFRWLCALLEAVCPRVADRMASSRDVLSNPGAYKLPYINGVIKRMSREELKKEVAKCQLNDRGEQHVLQQRLKSYFKKVKANLSAGAFDRADVITTYEDQGVDYFCVVDFEATCWEDQDFKSAESEIIEFPAVLLNAKSLVKEAEFHSYCRPAINPVLSEFCTSLTGITQVSGAARVYGFLGDRMSLLKQQLSITGGQINNHCLLCQW